MRICIYILACAILLLSASPVLAQKKIKNSLLWKISGKQLTAPSYIFGTFHLMCKSDFVISPALKEKIQSSQQFYGELDMDDPSMQTTLMKQMRLKDNHLKALMREDEYKAVSDSFRSITGMPLAMFDQFSPFIPLSLLTLNSIGCADRIQPEGEFVKLAKDNALPILGLETVDDQVHAINSQPLDSQIIALRKIALNYDSVKLMMVKMISVYKENHIEKLYQFMKDNGDGTDHFEQEMLIKRNRKWIPVMTKAMQEKPSFFAVGAGHLGGKEGVVALLKEQGYKVTPVRY